MKNKLGFLGFLGLLGILGFITQHYAYLLFFAFIYFIRYFWIIPDELFMENVRKAATPAFFVEMILTVLATALTAFDISVNFFIICLIGGIAASFLVFTVSLAVYEFREGWNKQQ